MPSLSLASALSTQSGVSQPIVILAVALGLAGVAILLLFAKDRI